MAAISTGRSLRPGFLPGRQFSVPAVDGTLDKMPFDEMPFDERPLDKMPLDEMPLDKMPLDELSVDEMT
jgi:hypothetical protein